MQNNEIQMRIIIFSISTKGTIITQNDKDEDSEEDKYLLTESDHDSSKSSNSKLFGPSAIFLNKLEGCLVVIWSTITNQYKNFLRTCDIPSTIKQINEEESDDS